MATVVSNVLEALKFTYGVNKVLYLFNRESPTFNILGRVKKPVGGRTDQFRLPVVVANPGAWTGIVEGGTLPTALAPDTSEAFFGLQEFAGMYDLSWKLLQDARNDKFAFQTALSFMEEGIRNRIIKLVNADLIDDGRGRLGVWTAADNATPVTSAFLPRLETGMKVDCMDTDNDTKNGDSLTITGVNPQTREVSFSGSVASTGAGDYFVIEDTTDISINGALHTNGLLGVIDDANPATVVGNYGSINRSTAGFEFWKSVVLDNAGTNRPLTEDLLLQAMDFAREKGGGQLKAWLSNLPILRRYHEILAAERFFAMSAPGTIGGGVGRKNMGADSKDGATPYEFSGIPWHVDPYFTNNIVIGLDTNHFFLGVGENEVPQPVSEVFDGATKYRQTTSATFEVPWYWQSELLSDNPAAGVKIEDVAES